MHDEFREHARRQGDRPRRPTSRSPARRPSDAPRRVPAARREARQGPARPLEDRRGRGHHGRRRGGRGGGRPRPRPLRREPEARQLLRLGARPPFIRTTLRRSRGRGADRPGWPPTPSIRRCRTPTGRPSRPRGRRVAAASSDRSGTAGIPTRPSPIAAATTRGTTIGTTRPGGRAVDAAPTHGTSQPRDRRCDGPEAPSPGRGPAAAGSGAAPATD